MDVLSYRHMDPVTATPQTNNDLDQLEKEVTDLEAAYRALQKKAMSLVTAGAQAFSQDRIKEIYAKLGLKSDAI